MWGQPNPAPYVKDAFHEYVIAGKRDAVNPAKSGTKAAAHYVLDVPAGGSKVVRLRLSKKPSGDAFASFDQTFADRLSDADEFYHRITPANLTEDEKRVHRQALAGMLWSKQYYFFDLDRWLIEHNSHPLTGSGKGNARNPEWFHMLNSDIISMPDKWEYPWYAAWDLAFHTISLSLVDFDFAKEQLLLMLRNSVRPSQRTDSRLRVELQRRESAGARLGDLVPLPGRDGTRARRPALLGAVVPGLVAELQLVGKPQRPARPQRLRRRLSWPRQHRRLRPQRAFAYRRASGPGRRNCMDGVLLPVHAGDCADSDRIRLRCTRRSPIASWSILPGLLTPWTVSASNKDEMWDPADGFFYDLLHLPNGDAMRMKIRSMVGLLPLCAATVFDPGTLARHPRIIELIELFRKRHPDVIQHIGVVDGSFTGYRRP